MAEANLLQDSGLPIFFPVSAAAVPGVFPAQNPHGASVRMLARSLTVMQKEAVVTSAATGLAWRLASDEGPYLDGFDTAPCPLSFMTVGMVASYMNGILGLAREQGVEIRDVTLIQDNCYTMRGSALRGTMIGGALPVDLEARIDSPATDAALSVLVDQAVRASPVAGLLGEVLPSRFSLTHNGTDVRPGRVAALSSNGLQAPASSIAGVRPDESRMLQEPLIAKLESAEVRTGVAGGVSTSLQADQDRKLHVRGVCRVRPDGVKEIVQSLFSPIGSSFRFLSEEAPPSRGDGRAPDALTYMSAGLAFCFMTQLGRYAKIAKKALEAYDVVQDAHWSAGGVDPFETHVFLRSRENDDFARMALDMGEQTCFLHALCRTASSTNVKVTRP